MNVNAINFSRLDYISVPPGQEICSYTPGKTQQGGQSHTIILIQISIGNARDRAQKLRHMDAS
jgi:hypothetical protein